LLLQAVAVVVGIEQAAVALVVYVFKVLELLPQVLIPLQSALVVLVSLDPQQHRVYLVQIQFLIPLQHLAVVVVETLTAHLLVLQAALVAVVQVSLELQVAQQHRAIAAVLLDLEMQVAQVY
jgi:hypothetical protein